MTNEAHDEVQARLDAAAEARDDETQVPAQAQFYGNVTTGWALLPGPDGSWTFQLGIAVGDAEPEGLGLEISQKQLHAWRDLNGDTLRQRTMYGLLELVAEGIAKTMWEQIDAPTALISVRKTEKQARVQLEQFLAEEESAAHPDPGGDPLPEDTPADAGEVAE